MFKANKMEEDLKKEIYELGRCPDCGTDYSKFLMGPEGGGSQNVKCPNCKSEFYVCYPFPPGRVYRRMIVEKDCWNCFGLGFINDNGDTCFECDGTGILMEMETEDEARIRIEVNRLLFSNNA